MFGRGGSLPSGGLKTSEVPDTNDTGKVTRRDLRSALLYNGGTGTPGGIRQQILAPWKSSGEGHSAPRGRGIPEWIHRGARLSYVSRSTGKMMEVLVERIDRMKQEVRIVFASDRNTWKHIPFSAIGHRKSPLLGPWTGGHGPQTERDAMLRKASLENPDKDFLIGRMKGDEKASVVVLDDDEDKASRDRSRSPKR
eukprot:TRINITY_DN46601_c0_g1_i1.p1 TRINITY_DN46601_c0_g1~~TRINITY_DN46601_c0_g1_i1.p1  ORF type:complete len:211 (+),score=22.94 TRINITY_DN46601_c0_g1_i1:46-633(+)